MKPRKPCPPPVEGSPRPVKLVETVTVPNVSTVAVVPPGRNRKRWQRLSLSLFGVAIIATMWKWAVFHFYSLPEASFESFTSITNNAFYTVGAIVIFMVTGRMISDIKTGGISSAISAVKTKPPSTKHLDLTEP